MSEVYRNGVRYFFPYGFAAGINYAAPPLAATGQDVLTPIPSTGPSPFSRPPPPLFRTEWRAQLFEPFDPYLEDARELIRTVEARALYAPAEREALAQRLEQVAVAIRPRSPRAAVLLLTAATRIRALPPSASTGQIRMGLPQGVDIQSRAVPPEGVTRAPIFRAFYNSLVALRDAIVARRARPLIRSLYIRAVEASVQPYGLNAMPPLERRVTPHPVWGWFSIEEYGFQYFDVYVPPFAPPRGAPTATGQLRMGLPQGVDITAPSVDVRAAPRFDPVRPPPRAVDFVRGWARTPTLLKAAPDPRSATVLQLPLHAEIDVESMSQATPPGPFTRNPLWLYVSVEPIDVSDSPSHQQRVRGYLEAERVTYRSPIAPPFAYETACARPLACWVRPFPGAATAREEARIPAGFPLVILRGVRRAPGALPGTGPWFLVHAPTLLGVHNEGWLPGSELTRFPT